MLKLAHADRVVGVRHHEEEARAKFQYYFELGAKEDLPIHPLANHDRDIVAVTLEALSSQLERFGRTQTFELPSNHLYIVEDGATFEWVGGKFSGGTHSSIRASVIVDRCPDDLDFALGIFHELWHAKSYVVLQRFANGSYGSRRSGLGMNSQNGKYFYFRGVDEGLTGIATRIFYEEVLMNHKLFRKAVASSNAQVNTTREEDASSVERWADDILEKSRESFSTREEVLAVFFDTQLNGQLLPLARLIEKVYGSGSFRRFGELSGYAKE